MTKCVRSAYWERFSTTKSPSARTKRIATRLWNGRNLSRNDLPV